MVQLDELTVKFIGEFITTVSLATTVGIPYVFLKDYSMKDAIKIMTKVDLFDCYKLTSKEFKEKYQDLFK